MAKILNNSKETEEYLNALPKAYIAACWADQGVRGFPFSGKYEDKEKTIPLVWDYFDFNGTVDERSQRDLSIVIGTTPTFMSTPSTATIPLNKIGILYE